MLLCRVYHLLYVFVVQMKTPMTLGQKKAKMIEQLLEELGVGEESQTLNTTIYSSIVPVYSSILQHTSVYFISTCRFSTHAY